MKHPMSSTNADVASSLRKPPSLLRVPLNLHVSHQHQWSTTFRLIITVAILDFVLPHTVDPAFHHPLIIHTLSLLSIEMERR
jgi:hypothetical protein